jgi:hypothetical protein
MWSADHQWSVSYINVIRVTTRITKKYRTKLIKIHKQVVQKYHDTSEISLV